jgi:primosomal protein N' (replication factor Y)
MLIPVLLPLKFDRPLTYEAEEKLAPGTLVEVPLGKRKIIGCVWDGTADKIDKLKLKNISAVLRVEPLQKNLLDFIEWVSNWTLSPRGQVLKLVLRESEILHKPKAQKLIRLAHEEADNPSAARQRVFNVLRDSFARQRADILREAGVSAGVLATLLKTGALEEVEVAQKPPPALNPDAQDVKLNKKQKEIAEVLRALVQEKKFQVSLLHGATGSGKTEVYFEAVAEAVRQGKQALVLVPEIALTAQFLERFSQRFGGAPAEWHSQISQGKRARLWHQIGRNDVQVIVGARSALFLPYKNLGLIIVDEEHEQAYRQEDHVLYHARDMAVVRARIENCPAILCSATPSLESWSNAEAGRYKKFTLPERYGEKAQPAISAIDLRSHKMKALEWLSPPLKKEIEDTLARNEQVLLFLNRRGYAPLTLCRACGFRITCPQCAAYLVEHKRSGRLQCHHCGYSKKIPEACPSCGAKENFTSVGLGVERLTDDVRTAFPKARTLTLSSDLTGSMKQLRGEIDRIANHEVDLVIGTQLVAKGHNFPGLTLVGVIDGDFSLGSGDPRAGERTFQVLHQVIGRAGRGKHPGRALVQTHAPEHPVLKALLAGDQNAFYAAEAAQRQAAGLPPFGRLAAFIISAADAHEALRYAKAFLVAAPRAAGVKILGPAEAPLSRLKGRYRYRLLIKAPREFDLQAFVRAWLLRAPKTKGSLRCVVDIDPYSFL